MSNNIRIRTTPNGGDKYVKLQLNQDFDFIEILSLKISEEDAYRKFCSDYGVLVGRVTVNSNFGVSNAKVSIFVPIDDIDKQDPLIKGLYPYEFVTDKNSDGVRYNVLPKVSETNNTCFTPVGTFPTKREVLDNETIEYIYNKYYKFTTTTNSAGDYMFFGIPIGTYTVHVDVDLSDIGNISQRPYDMIRDGSSPKFFESSTKFKGGTNLDKLTQIKSTNVGVNVQPFWGDVDNCEIGITRSDIDLNFTVTPCAIFMGSIFGDQNKNSVNKQCRPRGKFGLMCEQVAGEGTIEMIRKNLDGEVEEFSVEGGMVIDSDGTWAYQIPMNLDYVVTNEFGELVPTENTSVGIPTRTNVRFRIGMDETGGEGRLRTRAKYLVPNNPRTQNEIDYDFGPSTKESSFKDLYWNKIYTVSNFVSRYQNTGGLIGVKPRTFTGIKNVDECAGDKTPFPYNRVNTKANPIFFIICLIITIVGLIVGIINYTIVYIINNLIKLVNRIADAVSFGGARDIGYVPCITVNCETEQGSIKFAPGCRDEGLDAVCGTETGCAINYCGDIYGHECPSDLLVGWDKCISFELAKQLNMFEFDFYNDWVNGTLFAFLLKYKKRKKGTEKFCEFDCDDFKGDPNYSGVDGNGNGKPDNLCHKHVLMDTCFDNGCTTNDCQSKFHQVNDIKEGLIKKYDGELYYSSVLHNASYKLFATDLVCLGSVFECDWQGIPFLQPYLIETTYKLPPDVIEETVLPNNNTVPSTTGMVYTDGNFQGLFFNINCIGLHSDGRQCLNLRHMCEFGVDLDEMIDDPFYPNSPILPNGYLGPEEIDQLNESFRNSFIILNSGQTTPNSFIYNQNINTNFNTINSGVYNFSSISDNGLDYARFRNIPFNDNYAQPSNSLFMYFGILPGKTALNKMNQKYFAYCKPTIQSDILIDTTITPDSDGTYQGLIKFSILGGIPEYIYTITNITNGNSSQIVSGATNPQTQEITINGLGEGTYVITVIDSGGSLVTKTVFLGGTSPLYCSAEIISNVSAVNGTDGTLLINAYGGKQPYTFELRNSNGNLFGTPSNGQMTNSQTINNLSVDTYSLKVLDANQDICLQSGLTISGPVNLGATFTVNGTSCFNGSDGSILINVSGGISPYTVTTSGPAGYNKVGTYLGPLMAGQYTTTIIDSNSTSVSYQTTVPQAPALVITSTVVPIGAQFTHSITLNGGTPPYRIKYNNVTYPINNSPYIWTFQSNTNSLAVIILDDNDCQKSYTSQ